MNRIPKETNFILYGDSKKHTNKSVLSKTNQKTDRTPAFPSLSETIFSNTGAILTANWSGKLLIFCPLRLSEHFTNSKFPLEIFFVYLVPRLQIVPFPETGVTLKWSLPHWCSYDDSWRMGIKFPSWNPDVLIWWFSLVTHLCFRMFSFIIYWLDKLHNQRCATRTHHLKLLLSLRMPPLKRMNVPTFLI